MTPPPTEPPRPRPKPRKKKKPRKHDPKKMSSQELGLTLARQLLGLDDLHYGYWDDALELSVANFGKAQQRYTEFVLAALPPAASRAGGLRLLDVGCGTGKLLAQALDRGYHVDGVSPSPYLSRLVRERLAARPGAATELFDCRFEEFPAERCRNQYDVVLFAESFQYIEPKESFPKLARLVAPGGQVVICDFFQTAAEGDGGAGDGSFGGGHPWDEFQAELARWPFVVRRDEELTGKVSPGLKLLNDLLMLRLKPVVPDIHRYLKGRHPVLTWLGLKLLGGRLRTIEFKYFSGHRSQEVFERYKTYRLLVLEHQPR